MARSGISWALPWPTKCSQVFSVPENSKAVRGAEVRAGVEAGGVLKAEGVGPKDGGVKSGYRSLRQDTVPFLPGPEKQKLRFQSKEHSAALRVPFRLGGKCSWACSVPPAVAVAPLAVDRPWSAVAAPQPRRRARLSINRSIPCRSFWSWSLRSSIFSFRGPARRVPPRTG